MSANDLERRIADFYATEAPSRAPEWLLETVLATVDKAPQRRVLVRVPWRFPAMNRQAKVAAMALIVLAITAMGLAVAGAVIRMPPDPSPSPTPAEASAADFRRPFVYALPEGAGFELGPTGPSMYEFRVPESAGPNRAAVGIIVQAIGAGRTDPCTVGSVPRPLPGGPQAVIDYLESVPVLDVTDQSGATVDGRPAFQALITAGAPTTSCPEIELWVDGENVIAGMPRGLVLRTIVVDVDGEHIVITVFGPVVDPSWRALADEVISSFRFVTTP